MIKTSLVTAFADFFTWKTSLAFSWPSAGKTLSTAMTLKKNQKLLINKFQFSKPLMRNRTRPRTYSQKRSTLLKAVHVSGKKIQLMDHLHWWSSLAKPSATAPLFLPCPPWAARHKIEMILSVSRCPRWPRLVR